MKCIWNILKNLEHYVSEHFYNYYADNTVSPLGPESIWLAGCVLQRACDSARRLRGRHENERSEMPLQREWCVGQIFRVR